MNDKGIIFDQYSRYRACADLLKAAMPTVGKNVLDIGSGSLCLLGKFLQDANITYLDPLVQTDDATHLRATLFTATLDPGLFQAVVSVDTFEHIPPDQRVEFLEKATSIASKVLILGFPSKDFSEASSVDRAVAAAYEKVFPGKHEWLCEHEQFGLPSAEETAQVLRRLGWNCTSIGHGHAPWIQTFLSAVLPAWEIQRLKHEVFALSATLNSELFPFEFEPPFYRTFIVATRGAEGVEFNPPQHVTLSKNEATQHFQDAIKKFNSDCLTMCLQICRQRDNSDAKTAALEETVKQLSSSIANLQNTWSWRLTKPLRNIKHILANRLSCS